MLANVPHLHQSVQSTYTELPEIQALDFLSQLTHDF